MNRLALVFLSLLVTSAASLAQDSAPAEPERVKINIQGPAVPEVGWMLQDTGNLERAANEVFFMTMAGDQEVVKNAPFTGTVVNESTQTLSDGNRIVRKSSGLQARDSQGRIRREEALQRIGVLNVEAPRVVLISDPVSHTDYMLLPEEQLVRVTKQTQTYSLTLRRKLEASSRELRTQRVMELGNGDGKHEEPSVKHEDLGMQDVEGVACHGTRETVTMPAGQIGNERPIVSTTEIWTSEDLHEVVLKKHTDPRYGETVYRLTNIKLGEPDASLFQVPSGYKTIKSERTVD